MREIKFRAWHKEDKRFIDLNGFEIAFKGFSNQGAVTDVIEQGNLSMIKVDDVELLQYSNSKDESDKEIYEGDIIKGRSFYGSPYRSKRFIGEVNFCPSALSFIVVGVKQFSGISFHLRDISHRKIIGNAQENPELFEVNNES